MGSQNPSSLWGRVLPLPYPSHGPRTAQYLPGGATLAPHSDSRSHPKITQICDRLLKMTTSRTRNTHFRGSRVPKAPPKSTKVAPKVHPKSHRFLHRFWKGVFSILASFLTPSGAQLAAPTGRPRRPRLAPDPKK